MPVGLNVPSSLLPVAGIKIGVAGSNIRYQGRNDMVLMVLGNRATTAAVYTKNR